MRCVCELLSRTCPNMHGTITVFEAGVRVYEFGSEYKGRRHQPNQLESFCAEYTVLGHTMTLQHSVSDFSIDNESRLTTFLKYEYEIYDLVHDYCRMRRSLGRCLRGRKGSLTS